MTLEALKFKVIIGIIETLTTSRIELRIPIGLFFVVSLGLFYQERQLLHFRLGIHFFRPVLKVRHFEGL